MQVSVGIDVADPGVIEDFVDDALDNLATEVEEVAGEIVQTAQRLVNVDTGDLRADIDEETTRISRDAVRIAVGNDVHYGVFQEMLYPYLRPAFLEHKDDLTDAMERAIIAAAEAHGLR